MISVAHALAYPAILGPELRKLDVNDTLYMDDVSWYTSLFSLCAPFGKFVVDYYD